MTVIPKDSYGHYEIEHMLGRGAMGIVYAARDRRIGRRVALKTIELAPKQFADETAADQYFRRLQREAEVCGSLHHPNIVTLYEAGYDDGGRISYLAMELVEGETLLSLIKRFRPDPVPVDMALRVAEDVLRGLCHAHSKSIIHRDIKPANILLTGDGTAKLADFGIARPQDSDMTGADVLLGTPNYMPPEQVLGERLTTQADLFSLGVLLYEMLTATKPFSGSEISTVLHHIVRSDAPSVADLNPGLPPHLGDFVARLMSKSLERRPTAEAALKEIAVLRRPPSVAQPANGTVLRANMDLNEQHGLPARPAPLRRPLYAVIVVTAVLLSFLAVLGRSKAWLDSAPSITIPPSRQREFAEKRQEMTAARAAYEADRFAESVKRYDAYLDRYPHSTAAREGRKRAAAALEKERQADRKKAARSSRKQNEDIPPAGFLHRLKKVFRH